MKVKIAEVKVIVAEVKAEVGNIQRELGDIKGEPHRAIGMLIGEVRMVKHELKHLDDTIQELVKIVRRN